MFGGGKEKHLSGFRLSLPLTPQPLTDEFELQEQDVWGPGAVVQSCDTFSLSLAGLTHPQLDPKWQHCGASPSLVCGGA